MQPETNNVKAGTALIVCGALVPEVLQLKAKHGWDAHISAVPALLHNHPDRLPDAIQKRIRAARQEFGRVVVVYGDCGTGGQLDRLLGERRRAPRSRASLLRDLRRGGV